LRFRILFGRTRPSPGRLTCKQHAGSRIHP
jgi:hypothetical protein